MSDQMDETVPRTALLALRKSNVSSLPVIETAPMARPEPRMGAATHTVPRSYSSLSTATPASRTRSSSWYRAVGVVNVRDVNFGMPLLMAPSTSDSMANAIMALPNAVQLAGLRPPAYVGGFRPL